MKRIMVTLLILGISVGLFGCGISKENSIPSYTPNELSTMEAFEILCKAVEADTTGYFSDIKLGTDAYAAIVAIEKLYKSNISDSTIITQIYYYAEVISLVNTSVIFGEKYYNQAMTYAKQIDQSYDGPYATEIISLAQKYVGSNNDTNEKTALTMSKSEKEKVKEYINKRYDYYDSINGGYTGDKYTTTIWEEAAREFGITITDVDMIWQEH